MASINHETAVRREHVDGEELRLPAGRKSHRQLIISVCLFTRGLRSFGGGGSDGDEDDPIGEASVR